MSKILVVNPDPTVLDRAVGLLNSGCDWQAQSAADATAALRMLDQDDFELILLDLAEATADGHAFLERVRGKRKVRPVLLTGTEGTVDQVVRALQAGAEGFVHTSRIEAELVDHIIRVTSAAHRNKCHARLLSSMTSSSSTFELDNDPLMLPTLLTRFQTSVTLFGICDEADRTRIGIALEEALSNALYHGNLEVSSDLRKEDLEAYYELAGERRFSEPYASRKIRVTEMLTADSATFTIRDDGPGFDVAGQGPGNDEDQLECLSGRGLLMMRSFMDEVIYNDKGNQVTLIKRRPALAARMQQAA
jgi:anti-sigma regulatory factor (Ser/Thr protein kinase)/DNA-binding NarL/FixJ family response regulator